MYSSKFKNAKTTKGLFNYWFKNRNKVFAIFQSTMLLFNKRTLTGTG